MGPSHYECSRRLSQCPPHCGGRKIRTKSKRDVRKVSTSSVKGWVMRSVKAVFRKGRLELTEPVDWPEGAQVNVTLLCETRQRVDWLSLPPLDVGQFRELSAEDDLLAELLNDFARFCNTSPKCKQGHAAKNWPVWAVGPRLRFGLVLAD